MPLDDFGSASMSACAAAQPAAAVTLAAAAAALAAAAYPAVSDDPLQCHTACAPGLYTHVTNRYKSLQAEVVTKLRTFADVCAHPSAKRTMVYGRTGPVNAVEVDGALFIQNDEAEAKAEALRSKAMEPAREVAAASKAATAAAAASEVAAPALAPEPAVATAALDPEPCCAAASPAVVKSSSYAAAVSKPPVGPKFSAAASQLPADLKRSTVASKPVAAVLTPLEVNM